MTHPTGYGFAIAALLALITPACDRADEPPREPENTAGDALAPDPAATTGWSASRFEAAITPRIHFAFDTSAIRPEAAEALDTKVEALRANPDARVRVAGHCDERGPTWYNEALGRRRAEAARQYMVRNGIAADRIEVVSYGETRPLEQGSNPQAWAANRRAEFEVLSGAPGGR